MFAFGQFVQPGLCVFQQVFVAAGAGDGDALFKQGARPCRIANLMRDNGVLISTDGPFDNVLKIKPPLAFGRREADIMLESLAQALRDVRAV